MSVEVVIAPGYLGGRLAHSSAPPAPAPWLAQARKLLSARFDRTLGDDDREREVRSVDVWSEPGSSPSEGG
jgi:hypothetical protein